MNRIVVILSLFIITIPTCTLYHDEYYTEGYVADAITKKGIDKAVITLTSGTDQIAEDSTYSDSKGYFKLGINLAAGDSSYAGVLTIEKQGYKIYSKKLFGFSGSITDSFYVDPD